MLQSTLAIIMVSDCLGTYMFSNVPFILLFLIVQRSHFVVVPCTMTCCQTAVKLKPAINTGNTHTHTQILLIVQEGWTEIWNLESQHIHFILAWFYQDGIENSIIHPK